VNCLLAEYGHLIPETEEIKKQNMTWKVRSWVKSSPVCVGHINFISKTNFISKKKKWCHFTQNRYMTWNVDYFKTYRY